MPDIKQLTGPGVEGLEDEAATYHFDLSMEELWELISDPESFLAKLGLPTSGARSILLSRWNEAYSVADGWQPRGGKTKLPNLRAPRACCTTGDGGMTCTVWK